MVEGLGRVVAVLPAESMGEAGVALTAPLVLRAQALAQAGACASVRVQPRLLCACIGTSERGLVAARELKLCAMRHGICCMKLCPVQQKDAALVCCCFGDCAPC